MFAKIENVISFGGQYLAASAVYFGLTMILFGAVILDPQRVRATDEEQPQCTYTVEEDHEGTIVEVEHDGCPEGQFCCNGECISEEEICCEDGT